jgi:hypothetical protein
MPNSRPSITPKPAGSIVHDNTTGQLVKRNREIAEVRDQMDKSQKQLATGQARNKVLLEEASELDSEIYRQCDRCAKSEERCALLEDEARLRDEEQAQQHAKHEAADANAENKVERIDSELKDAEAKANEEQRLAELAAVELAGFRASLEVEEEALEKARQAREEFNRPRESAGPAAAAAMAAEAQRKALQSQCDAQKAEEATLRQRAKELEAERSKQKESRIELVRRLQEADAKGSDHAGRLQELEAAVAAKGGDASAIVAEVHAEARAAATALGGDAPRPSIQRRDSQQLEVFKKASDLQKVQEKRKSLELNAGTLREQGDQDAQNLQAALDDARSQLQRTLREAANSNALEVSKLESEVQKERQTSALEAVTEQHCIERIDELKRATRDTQSRSELATESRRQQQLAEAARCTTLSSELVSVRAEMGAAEGRLTASTRRAAEAEVRRAKAEAEGHRRVAKVRGMIEKLWSEIRSQAELSEAGMSRQTSPSEPLRIPGVPARWR